MRKILMFILISTSHHAIFSQDHSPPVQNLLQLIENDTQFAETVDAMLAGVQDLADGSENPWHGKRLSDLCEFLNDWYVFLPGRHDGLDRIIHFSLLYYKNPAGMRFIMQEPGKSWALRFIDERGKFMDSPESLSKVKEWLADETLNHDDFITPSEGFTSFNHFFTRLVKPGARPVTGAHDESIIVSPADGIINMVANELTLESQIPTKGRMTMSLSALLGDSPYAEQFVGGSALAVFLLPDNYHHYHSPVDGVIVESKSTVGDRLFGMPDIIGMINNGNPGYGKDYSVLEHFKHGYFIIETNDFGYVGMVPIGLQTVGSVVFESHVDNVMDDPLPIFKGERLGHFKYGGSTVLLIFEPGRMPALTVQQGQRIGQFSH